AYLLWSTLYAGKHEIGGLTFEMMITYYVAINLVSKIDMTEKLAYLFSNEIRTGAFTKYIVKPLNLKLNFFYSWIGLAVIPFIVNVIATFVWSLILGKYIVINLNIKTIFITITFFLLGLYFQFIFNYFLTLLTFWMKKVSSFFLLKRNLLEILTGQLIPLALFPPILLGVLKFLPFYYVYHYPMMIYFDKTDGNFYFGVICMLSWIIFFSIVNRIICHFALKKYTGVGI
ncbi:MAG: hypothetical protein GY756_21580, partial [bacterium]|nr:hypothetical protein [bacterium]